MVVLAQEYIALESDEWRPYVYMKKGEPTGVVFETVKAVFERADVAYEFNIKPWARVYRNGLSTKNYFISGIGRTPEREDLFQWIGPITKVVDVHFYKLKENPIQINNIEEAKKYITGVVRGSYFQNFIDSHFAPNQRQLVSTHDQLLKMLVLKRLDYVLLEERRVLNISDKLGIDPNIFEKSLFVFSVQSYLASSLNTEDELVSKLRKSYAELIDENLITLH
jgi:ABC-type amino acid transport substrate-binding protein